MTSLTFRSRPELPGALRGEHVLRVLAPFSPLVVRHEFDAGDVAAVRFSSQERISPRAPAVPSPVATAKPRALECGVLSIRSRFSFQRKRQK